MKKKQSKKLNSPPWLNNAAEQRKALKDCIKAVDKVVMLDAMLNHFKPSPKRNILVEEVHKKVGGDAQNLLRTLSILSPEPLPLKGKHSTYYFPEPLKNK